LFRAFCTEAAGDERDEGLPPELTAEGIKGGDEVDGADEEDAFDGAGKSGQVQCASVVLFPTECQFLLASLKSNTVS
jgi:hypothetical protein